MKKNYTKNTAFRTTEENFERYSVIAAKDGITLGEWIRRTIEKEAKRVERRRK